ncbi:MAG: cytochrome o ubiquinol oxidase subunit IV [bacterium]|jgi:cytochrome o ubiquinol oxidase subunit IV
MKKDNRLTNYAIGYATCILLTLIAYLIASLNYYRNWAIIATIATLALIQFVIQIVFFLHLSKEKKDRWRLYVFISMILVVLILVIGSIWIMNNLDSNMMLDQKQSNHYLRSQDGL